MNLVWNIVNFIVLYLLLRHFLIGPVMNIMNKRQAMIEQNISNARESEGKAAVLKKEYEEKISFAEEEKEQILADIKKQGYEEYEKIVDDAKKKGEQIITEAKHNAEVEAFRTRDKYAADIKDMVIDAASKIAATKHSTEDDLSLYDKFIDEAVSSKNG
jgi:ATP synthase F0 subunit b